MKKYQSIKGFYDVLPEQQKYWRFFYDKAYQILDRYAYQEIKLPVLSQRIYTFTVWGSRPIL